MKTLAQHLAELPGVVLEAIARSHGLTLPPVGAAPPLPPRPYAAASDGLAAALLDPSLVQTMWRDLRPEERDALQSLVVGGNLMPVASFQRRWGEIRRLGGGSLQRLRPWLHPANVSESLWYRGLIARGFAETPEGLVECFAIPTDLLPLLALPVPAGIFPLPAPAMVDERAHTDGDAFLDDLVTLLIHLHNHAVWANNRGQWRRKDLDAVLAQWQTPPAQPDHPLALGGRGALLFHCLGRLDFVMTQSRRQRLNHDVVAGWLEQDRHQGRRSLFDAWRSSSDWNDLCLTPGLVCIEGNWRNDPVRTRAALFESLRQASVDVWYGLDAFVAAMHAYAPDFQRPDGNYDTWYLRDDDGASLRGFEHWQEVEGRLLRYLWRGPLFWLGVIALDANSHHWRLTANGAAWLAAHGQDTTPSDPPPPSLIVYEDFRMLLPSGAKPSDRFRAARFAEWEASWLGGYRYRISQGGLRRAAAAGIRPAQIIDFLDRSSGGALPANVRRALASFRP